VIVRVCVYGKILSKDHHPHEQSIYGCRLPGRIMCRRANPNLESKTSPLHYPLSSRRPPGLHLRIQGKDKQTTNKNKSHNRPADTAHGETPLPLDCDPKVVKPVPRPFVLDRIQSKKERKKERRKEREIDPFPPLSRLSWMAAMELVHQLLCIPEVFHWLPARMHISVSGPLNAVMELPISPFGVQYTINFPLFRVVDDYS
jgi:hypothetical protein